MSRLVLGRIVFLRELGFDFTYNLHGVVLTFRNNFTFYHFKVIQKDRPIFFKLFEADSYLCLVPNFTPTRSLRVFLALFLGSRATFTFYPHRMIRKDITVYIFTYMALSILFWKTAQAFISNLNVI